MGSDLPVGPEQGQLKLGRKGFQKAQLGGGGPLSYLVVKGRSLCLPEALLSLGAGEV